MASLATFLGSTAANAQATTGTQHPPRMMIGNLVIPTPGPEALTRAQDVPRTSQRGVGRKVLGAVVGGFAGFFAGGYLGAAIEGDRCHCDDPGLKGALIGMPIGAAAGGILGWRYLF